MIRQSTSRPHRKRIDSPGQSLPHKYLSSGQFHPLFLWRRDADYLSKYFLAPKAKQVFFSADQNLIIYRNRRCDHPLTHIKFTKKFETLGNISD